MKPIIWMSDSREGLREFSDEARREAGYQLNKVQFGNEPSDWKPMPSRCLAWAWV